MPTACCSLSSGGFDKVPALCITVVVEEYTHSSGVPFFVVLGPHYSPLGATLQSFGGSIIE